MPRGLFWRGHTIVDLLERDNGVLGQALLGVLIKQEGLWGDGALLGGGRRHSRVVVVWIHIDGGCSASGARPASQVEADVRRARRRSRSVSISNAAGDKCCGAR